jgi:predicted ATPase
VTAPDVAVGELSIEGYRSIRRLRLPLGRLNVFVGPNGSGKTNLYRALWLISQAASGGLARALADEGGMPSVLWAGERRKGPVRLTLAVELERFAYTLVLGLPVKHNYERDKVSLFTLDPEIKEERIVLKGGSADGVAVLERGGGSAWILDAEGERITFPFALSSGESALSEIREPQRFPHVAGLRQVLLGWRFYHHFRLDPDSAIRRPQVGVWTPVLAEDGRDLAAALQTIREVGTPALEQVLERAFPESTLEIDGENSRFELFFRSKELRRRFSALELSDGTLKFLCLAAALLSQRPPALLALNEPETSIHEDLLEPLAELLSEAARYSQVWITTHSRALAEHVRRLSGAEPRVLAKVKGETRLADE